MAPADAAHPADGGEVLLPTFESAEAPRDGVAEGARGGRPPAEAFRSARSSTCAAPYPLYRKNRDAGRVRKTKDSSARLTGFVTRSSSSSLRRLTSSVTSNPRRVRSGPRACGQKCRSARPASISWPVYVSSATMLIATLLENVSSQNRNAINREPAERLWFLDLGVASVAEP